LVNAKSYVGSSVNLSRRFKSYYNANYLKLSPAKTMLINKASGRGERSLVPRPLAPALIKYGYAKFSLEILEYCDKTVLLTREQYFLASLLPEYNLLKIAGSFRGYKHTEETKLKMGLSKKGFKHTEQTKARISKNLIHSEESKQKLRSYRHTEEAIAKIKASALGRKLSEEAKAKIRANHPKSLKVKVLNIETNMTMEFLSTYQAAEYFGVSRVTISNYIKNQKLYKNQYKIFI
jgi:group I intron endonuclease